MSQHRDSGRCAEGAQLKNTEFPAKSRAKSGEVLPPAPRINLTTPEDIRREMSRVYREARGGELDTSEGGRLIYMLSQIVKAYELGVIEKRLALLELATDKRR